MYNFFLDNDSLTKHQSGFRPKDSTVNQLAYLYHAFCEALDNHKDLRIVFCDISKAFDKVWHKGLIYKLKRAGISGNLLCLLTNYLSNRKQRVHIRGQTSEWGIINAGVPQGSVLGPLLFLVYINDIVENLTCHVKLFADDTILYVDLDNCQQSADVLNYNLRIIQDWADKWLVNFNPDKTKLLNISNKRNHKLNDHPIVFRDVQCDSVKEQKHLGIIFNDKLKWTNHVDYIIKGVGKYINVLQKLRYCLSRNTLQTIYFTYVRPKLEYCSIIWDDCSQQDKERLDNVQLKFARIISGAKRGTSHELIYNELEWTKLEDRRKQSKLTFLYKIVNRVSPDYLVEILPKTVNVNQATLRNDSLLRNFRTRTEKFRKSLFPDTIRLWNSLPENVRLSDSLNCFSTLISSKCTRNVLYNVLDRKLGIIHSQMRMNCSNLNAHLYQLHVRDNPFCECSTNVIEDSSHFFFDCPFYYNERIELITFVENLIPNVTIECILFGSDELSLEENLEMFKNVEEYISSSGRFG